MRPCHPWIVLRPLQLTFPKSGSPLTTHEDGYTLCGRSLIQPPHMADPHRTGSLALMDRDAPRARSSPLQWHHIAARQLLGIVDYLRQRCLMTPPASLRSAAVLVLGLSCESRQSDSGGIQIVSM